MTSQFSTFRLLSLFAKLIATIMITPAIVLGLYAWLFPLLHIKTAVGVIAGALAAGLLTFYETKRAIGTLWALILAPIVFLSTALVCMLSIVNVLGE